MFFNYQEKNNELEKQIVIKNDQVKRMKIENDELKINLKSSYDENTERDKKIKYLDYENNESKKTIKKLESELNELNVLISNLKSNPIVEESQKIKELAESQSNRDQTIKELKEKIKMLEKYSRTNFTTPLDNTKLLKRAIKEFIIGKDIEKRLKLFETITNVMKYTEETNKKIKEHISNSNKWSFF